MVSSVLAYCTYNQTVSVRILTNTSSVCIVSCVRLRYLLQVDFEGDITYTVVNAVIWSLLEPTLGVAVGSLPTMAPLFRKWLPGSVKSDQGYSRGIALASLESKNRKAFRPLPGGQDKDPEKGLLKAHTVSAEADTYTNAQSSLEDQRREERLRSDSSLNGPDTGINVVTEWEVRRY